MCAYLTTASAESIFGFHRHFVTELQKSVESHNVDALAYTFLRFSDFLKVRSRSAGDVWLG